MPRFLVILLAAALVSSCGVGPELEVPTPAEDGYTALDPVAIHAVSSRELYVAGSMSRIDGTPEGLILATETAGRTWRRLAVEVHDLGRLTFQCVFFSDRLRGWVGGIRVDDQGRTRGVIYRTQDGGNHWREVPLIQEDDVLISELHTLVFTSDSEGSVGVSLSEGSTGEITETTFSTNDAGRSWSVTAYREKAKVPFRDNTRSMVDEQRGFRLRKSELPGITLVEATASEGKDWMPISQLSLSALHTYY